jgi:hypothetical protein
MPMRIRTSSRVNRSGFLVAAAVLATNMPLAHATEKLKTAPDTGAAKAAAGESTATALRHGRVPEISPLLKQLRDARQSGEFRAALKELVDAMSITAFDPKTLSSAPAGQTLGVPDSARQSARDSAPKRWEGINEQSINDRLASKKPRGMIVGAPNAKASPDVLVSQDGTPKEGFTVTAEQANDRGGVTVVSITFDANGVPVDTKSATYDKAGNLVGWQTGQQHLGGTVHEEWTVIPGAKGSAEVSLTMYTVERGGAVTNIHAGSQRPHNTGQGDPALTLSRQRRAWMPLDESRGKDNAAWCNPLSGQCRLPGTATSGNRVNPTREASLPKGPRIEPKGSDINPSPEASSRKQQPRPLDRSTIDPGPGARPPIEK